MRRCSEAANVWTAEDLHSADGDLYEGHGTLWSCSGRLCPSCLAGRRRRMRARVREGLARVRPGGGDRWRLLTLTSPTMAGVSLLQVREVFNRAWSLFRKREWWQGIARAGVKGEEFTLGDSKRLAREGREWSLERDGYHFHIHLLVCSGWVEWARLGDEWTCCLAKAAQEKGVALSFNTSHGRAVVDVRLVVNRQTKKRGTVSLDGAVEEVSKYITKSESWLKVSDAQLLEVASVRRWFRAVELLGECRASGESVTRRIPPGRAESPDERAAKFRRANALRLAQWQEADPRARLSSALPGATCDGDDEADAWQDTDGWKERAASAVFAYLDTKNLSDGGDGDGGREIRPTRRRARPLRAVAMELDRAIWLEGLDEYVRDVREWRSADLGARFAYATFRTLGGGVWYGMRSNPASSFAA
jgi:replication protein